MDPKKIKIKPKIRVRRTAKDLGIKISPKEPDDEKAFEDEVEALRQRMSEKGFETETRFKPTAAQLERWKANKKRKGD